MSKKTSPFKYRMMYAANAELIDHARKYNCNWVVVASSGHKMVSRPLEDPPVYMEAYPKLAPYRTALRPRIEERRQQVRKLVRQAKQAGMKVIYNTYEPSLPAGFQEAYTSWFCTKDATYAMPGEDPADIREVCVSRPEIREALSVKVAELCRIFDIDGFAYTNNESATRAQVYHRCDRCKGIPFSQMMKHLNDAIAEGIRRSGKPIKLFNRCWGSHETDQQY